MNELQMLNDKLIAELEELVEMQKAYIKSLEARLKIGV